MDLGQPGSGSRAASIKAPGHHVVSLIDSGDDSDLNDALLMAQRGNGVNVPGLEILDASEESGDEHDDDNDSWDGVESIFEDSLEELGDESLFDNGEHL